MEVVSIEYNEKRRQELLSLGKDSTYFFAQAILGMKDLEEKPHHSLCENLDGRGEWGPWNRAMVCAFRGSLKSSVCTIAWPLHEAIYKPNWSARLVGSSHNNVRDNFFRKMLRLFRDGERRNLLLWLYQDRIKGDFEGWTDDQIVFIADDPLAQASITFKGLDSSHEGYHGDAIICHAVGTEIFDDGEWLPVEEHRSLSRTVEKDGLAVSVWGLPFEETVTKDHRYWVRRIHRYGGKKSRRFIHQDGWVEAGDLDGRCWIGTPIDQSAVASAPDMPIYHPGIGTLPKHCVELDDPEWWWAIGLWWGDGHSSGAGMIGWTVSDERISSRLRSLLERYGMAVYRIEKPGCHQIMTTKNWMKRWLRSWRSGNSRKIPPLWVERLPLGLQRALLDGYMDADGYRTGKESRITSIHLPGLLAARRMYSRLGIAATIRLGPPGGDTVICGVKCKSSRRYDLRITGRQERYDFGKTFIADGFLWSKVRRTRPQRAEFCPIQTDSGEYLTAFGRSHNCDDPEGADAEKSRVANLDAESAIDNMPPLLVNPNKGQILVVVTPWGGSPLAYKLRDKKGWKTYWLPIVDSEGKSNWPVRYPEAAVNQLRLTTAAKTWRTQYLLEKPSEGTSLFDWNAIKAGMYRWKIPGQVIEYPAIMVDKKKMDLGEENALKVVTRKVDVTMLRFYEHVDFIHRIDTVSTKLTGTARPSKMAIVIVGVAPDHHAFVMGYKTERLDLDQQVDAVYNYYRTWAPFEVTFDSVGAQHWFIGIAQMKERSDLRYRAIESAGKYGIRRQLPALSARLVEDKRSARVSKEDAIHERLEPWLSGAVLHIHETQDELIAQLKGFPDAVEYVDLVDALAQGPNVWKPGLGQDALDRQKKVGQIVRAEHTGYYSPFAKKKVGA